ncbi:transcriptional initiation protein Tat [Pelistega indica]|uniref:Transcriptional initiation protein Tat n=1 Tax=Pelistega indica TaxID=1414851 RepID=V8G9S4_9BURK|nr:MULTISPECIES: PhoX family phosphatase [Pelistega]ETD72693.1 transcriptional initiation protein Tat [Pelistega indica]
MQQFIDHDDFSTNHSGNEEFNTLLATQVSRRTILKTGVACSTMTFFGSSLIGEVAQAKETAKAVAATIGFKAVEAGTGDKIVVPEGYSYQVISRWGDPLFADSPKWKGDATESSADQAKQVGDNHDGMKFFSIDGKNDEGLLVRNHEYINPDFIFPKGVEVAGAGWNEDWVKKSQRAQGVSVVHIRLENGKWKPVLDSKYNRSINAHDTEMVIVGPAAGTESMKTNADPSGTKVIGTFGNCGNGFTPWNTYLTCEENVTDYFGSLKEGGAESTTHMKRYGVSSKDSEPEYRWETFDKRFDVAEEPNEWNRFGWIVEIDPFDPTSKPKKLSALGHFKHENAAVVIGKDGHVVVYMGDDQRSEYIYKFVSKNKYNPNNQAENRGLLDEGTLYVAQFLDGDTKGDLQGVGKWIPLTLESVGTNGKPLSETFKSMGELLVHTREAADLVGATPMDRPEWIAVHPQTNEVYVTLTNNSDRGSDKERKGMGGVKHPGVDDANPRVKNPYGQIVRWNEKESDPSAMSFTWDVYFLAGNPKVHPAGDLMAGTENITDKNLFNSPDGLAFDKDGRIWIQTDGNFSNKDIYEGMGNNQMLVAVPEAGDRKGEIRRFLVGPSGCEITGITFSPDYKYVFINVQHPGEYGKHPRAPKDVKPQDDPLAFSKWPMGDNEDTENSGGRPRAATVVIWRDDGGVVGA